jgi:hypothetical protein
MATLAASSVDVSGQACTFRVVPKERLVEAMQRTDGYDLAATTNAPRFGADVFIDLVDSALAAGPAQSLMLIRQQDWFDAFREVTGLTVDESPAGARLAAEHQQDMLIEYRPGQTVNDVPEGPVPDLALTVQAFWPQIPGGVDEYSFRDTLSVPPLRVTSKRIVRYRLLRYDHMIVYDEMEGMYGRPTGGFMGFIFSILGDAQLQQSRLAFADDGYHVMRARARKGFFTRTPVATFDPEGRGTEGIPDDRPDLASLAVSLALPIEVDYLPYPCDIG